MFEIVRVAGLPGDTTLMAGAKSAMGAQNVRRNCEVGYAETSARSARRHSASLGWAPVLVALPLARSATEREPDSGHRGKQRESESGWNPGGRRERKDPRMDPGAMCCLWRCRRLGAQVKAKVQVRLR